MTLDVPALSVVIPTFNIADVLEECLAARRKCGQLQQDARRAGAR